MNSTSHPHRDHGADWYSCLKNTNILILLSVTLLIAGCSRALKEDPPTPAEEVHSNDQLNIPDTPTGRAIISHFDAAFSLGPESEANYQRSLDTLRAHADESISILSTAYNEVDKMFYGDRWTLVQTLSDMRSMKALDELTSIAREELPKRDTLYDHELSPYNEESIIRITAIKGIGNLSASSDTAVSVLVTFFDHQDPVIRLEAINTLAEVIRAVEEPRKKLLMGYLPRDYVFIADIGQITPPGVADENPALRPGGAGSGPPPSK